MTGLGARMTLAWVRAYTRGAAPDAAERRVRELASDVWEHRSHALATGRSTLAADAAIVLRCLRGIPADISWRFANRAPGGIALMHTILRNALVLVSALLAAWFFVLAVAIQFDETADAWWSPALAVSGIAVLAGVWLMRRSPWAGCAVLAAGALPLAAITTWAIFPPILALAAVGLSVARARALSRGPATA